MRDQLKLLEDLQQHDARIQELETSLKAIPAKVDATRGDLQRVETLLAAERASLADAEKYLADQKQMMSDDETFVGGAKVKLGQAKNSKEYMAAQREMEQRREAMVTREAETAKLLEAIDAKRKLLDERAGEVAKLREGIDRDAEEARVKMAEIESKIAELRTERDKAAAGLDKNALKRYSTIRMRRGLAVVSVKNGICQGCNMNIPPQLYNMLQRGASLETCPSCQRIIYWDEIMKDPAPADGAAAPSGGEPATPATRS